MKGIGLIQQRPISLYSTLLRMCEHFHGLFSSLEDCIVFRHEGV